MKITLEVYPKKLKRKIYRKIEVDGNLPLKDFCEYIIISLNGTCKHLYQFVVNEEYTYLGPGNNIMLDTDEFMNDLCLRDVLVDNDYYLLNYNYRNDWDFDINILDIKQRIPQTPFKVIDGYGMGIIDDIEFKDHFMDYYSFKTSKAQKENLAEIFKERYNFISDEFDIESNNQKIMDYKNKYKDIVKPKNYILDISLDGLDKVINRELAINSDVLLIHLVIKTMFIIGINVDEYSILWNDKVLDMDLLIKNDLNYLELKEKDQFKIALSNFTLNVKVKEVKEHYNNNGRIRLLNGNGDLIDKDCKTIEDVKKLVASKNYNNTCDIEGLNFLIDITL